MVRVYSYNPLGKRWASVPGVLNIPAARDRIALPTGLTVIDYATSVDTKSTRRQEFAWHPVADTPSDPIVSYTVVWCWDIRDSCHSALNSTVLPANVTQFERTGDQKLRFAVAANSASSTSGLVWSQCYIDSNVVSSPQKVEHFIDSINDVIRLDWNKQCSGLYRNITISWCPICNEVKSCEHCTIANVPIDTHSYTACQMQRNIGYRFMINATLRHSNRTVSLGEPFDAHFKEPPHQYKTHEWVLICVAVVVGIAILAYTMQYVNRIMKECNNLGVDMPDILKFPEHANDKDKEWKMCSPPDKPEHTTDNPRYPKMPQEINSNVLDNGKTSEKESIRTNETVYVQHTNTTFQTRPKPELPFVVRISGRIFQYTRANIVLFVLQTMTTTTNNGYELYPTERCDVQRAQTVVRFTYDI